MWGERERAVTFQSMSRTSSPARYSLTSENDMPRPRKAVWYFPAKISFDRPRVLISILRTRRRISFSFSIIVLRDDYVVQDVGDDLLGGDVFGLGFVGQPDTVAQYVVADGAHVFGIT